ncbi:MAG TPA: hypothetical protein P5081_14335 [Phycisphaerae bacterium]|nr:hypothetical protein [Phycisphaerae bacterium]HRW54048.1 hypothetical protein [Phycisphaerae bacterium]
MTTGMDENVLQLAALDLAFQFLDLIINIVTNVLLPGILTPIFSAFIGLFTGGTTM